MNQLILMLGVAEGGAAGIVLTQPAECACGRMTFFVVNRNGATRCLDCDELERLGQAVEPQPEVRP